MLPMVSIGVVGVHVAGLHEGGSGNPLGTKGEVGAVVIWPYYGVKDVYGIVVGVGVLMGMVTLIPYWAGDAENYKGADSLVTPVHIVPEWYILYAYAMLRSVPNKGVGVLSLVGAIGLVAIVPWTQGRGNKVVGQGMGGA